MDAPDSGLADLQQAVADLRRELADARRELAERTTELTARNSAYGERIAYQAAANDVLQVMSASPGDPQPVFDLIVERARDLCGGYGATVYEFDGTLIHWRAATGVSDDPSARQALEAMYPMVPTREFPGARAILDRQIVYIRDLEAEPGLSPALRGLTVKSNVSVPLMRHGLPIGALILGSRERGVFSDSQVELLKTFADQAVIAITSAQTFRELHQRTGDLQESLDYQTATSDVLEVISRSTFDLDAVLQTVVSTAHRLCRADHSVLFRNMGGEYRWAAGHEMAAGVEEHERNAVILPGPGTLIGRAVLEGHAVQIKDAWEDPLYEAKEAARTGGTHSMLGVPLMREGKPIGAIGLARNRVELFSDREVELVSTFADQAVIAMENARLITETREALEQQTATAEVLGVINSSPGDLTPVFDAMLEKGIRLCEGVQGTLWTFDGVIMRLAASRGLSQETVGALRQAREFSDPGESDPVRRIMRGERVIQVLDLVTERTHGPVFEASAQLGGVHTIIVVGLFKDATPLGAFVISRREVRAFTDKQIALVQNFAAQAVIAMENARLITETREALDQQTATAEVLGVINSSPGDLAPVFQAMLEKATQLCAAEIGVLWTYRGDEMEASAILGGPPRYAEFLREGPRPLSPTHQRLRHGEEVIQITDVPASEGYRAGLPMARALVDLGDVRTILMVPLRKEDAVLGAFAVYRPEARPFSHKQIALLKNFSAQAVIAIENARLITETREALEQQTATAEVLGVINSSPGDLVPVFDAILEKAHSLCGVTRGTLQLYDGERFRAVATRNVPEGFAEFLRAGVPATENPVGRPLLAGERYVHITDLVERDHPALANASAEMVRQHTVLAVPLRKGDTLLGMIVASRDEIRPFTDKQISLLQSFAAQAVIAMENARLLNETREALEQQTATAEVLQVINASPGDLQPVFDAMLDKAMRLCEASYGGLMVRDGGRFRGVASRNLSPSLETIFSEPFEPSPTGFFRRAFDGVSVEHVPDLAAQPDRTAFDPRARGIVELGGARTSLNVALRKERAVLGAFALYRREVRPFTEKQIALVENFAAQAVVAMENARLITETREALEQQTATAEVLQVINASPGDLAPVFDAMLERAMRLCEAQLGFLSTYDGAHFQAVALHGVPEDYAKEYLSGPYRPGPNTTHDRLVQNEEVVHVVDLAAESLVYPRRRAVIERLGVRTILGVGLRKDGSLLGAIHIYRQEVRPFSDKQIALLQNFAEQAVIAMENARLLDEIRQRQAELRATFDNMVDGVAMFDQHLRLAAWNRNFQELLDLTDDVLHQHRSFDEYIRYLCARGEFGATTSEAEIARLRSRLSEHYSFERMRPDGRVIEVRHSPMPKGGIVLIYSDITERKLSEEEIRAARDAAEAAYRDLKAAQANLVQAEKMASLGQLTAGIAHEIKNPLNFVNNFAGLSVELLEELKEATEPAVVALGDDKRTEVDETMVMLAGNLQKIAEHGKRADNIVRSMLEHSRGVSGERREVNLNQLVEEALNLAYHGARAQDQSFNITLNRNYAESLKPIELAPQEITRVFLNLFGNGFYAANKRSHENGGGPFQPSLTVTTRDDRDAVEVRVRDNGTGIPAEIKDKLFQPFFTTKPTGEGTGLGLSISYDIVTQQHGGTISVESWVGEFTEFIVRLPRSYRAVTAEAAS